MRAVNHVIRAAPPRAILLVTCFVMPGVGKAHATQETTHLLDEGLVSRGLLRLGVSPTFLSWDSRYGIRTEGGVEIREVEPLAQELIHERGAIFPGFFDLENHVRELIGDSDFDGSAGVADAAVFQNVTRVDIGADLGV